MGFIYLVPQTTFFEMDGNGEAPIFHVMIWSHQMETTYKPITNSWHLKMDGVEKLSLFGARPIILHVVAIYASFREGSMYIYIYT